MMDTHDHRASPQIGDPAKSASVAEQWSCGGGVRIRPGGGCGMLISSLAPSASPPRRGGFFPLHLPEAGAAA